jgi:hypothetical protein
MSLTKRESIITAILALLETYKTNNPDAVKTVVRNRAPHETEKRPCLVLLDGDERSRTTFDRKSSRGGARMAPQIMQMQPQIVIILEDLKANDDTKGTRLNTLRGDLISLVAESAELRTMVGSNGSIIFNGSTTDLKTGGAIQGQMLLDFSFFYALII